MKAIWKIFITDLKNIGTNWVAMVLIGGLIILPSLYAWFNIAASWDPYGNTDQIPIGIVNEDEGATVRDQEIHAGDEVVKSLKENRSLDWKFVDREKAMDKLEYGDYFAVIVIPKNFSESLGTVISDQPEKADVEYYVNEKINAIAPKITEKGASAIVEQVTSNFISTVNEIIFEIFNDLGVEIEKNLPDIEKFEDYLFTLEKNLPEIHDKLNQTSEDANSAGDLINKAQDVLPRAKEVTSSGLKTIDNTTNFLNQAEDRLNKISPQIDKDLEKIQKMVSDTNSFVHEIDTSSIEFGEEKQISDSINSQIEKTLQSIGTIKGALKQVQEQNISNAPSNEQENQPDEGENEEENENETEKETENNIQVNPNQETINKAISELENMEQQLTNLQTQGSEIKSLAEKRKGQVEEAFSSIKERAETVNERVDAFVKEYKETIEPTVRNEVASAKQTLTEAREILVGIQSTIPEVESILNRTEGNLGDGKETLNKVLGEFPYINDKVNELANRIRNIQKDTDINEIIQLLQNNPEAEKGFFAEPVVLNQHKVFPIENYGTGMTPFYTVLSLWVGGLLLISLMSTEIHGPQAENYTERQIYFGRLLTFLSIGLFQTLIVTLGDLYLLDVNIKEPLWFILFGILCSAVFVTMVYTVVSVFGDVGKAIAIIMLVLQIAGSGGTYPVVLLPKFFQVISPFLPFTYAVGIMREAVGGIVWEKVAHDVVFLVIFAILALILGGVLKNAINKTTHVLGEKARESGLFH
ncbi:YhgE/Pip domain-containing protein [Oceanobacillus caeni]|uniref:YhgE/Pip domain-containing protein n=1 Tax=Oceanobacillus TaxID=182709 RepID=UPI000A9F0636|nr:YhgE/Pip domain-containing protein [Oceanobacillus caeni]MBU8790725.1 YhgE/Pip domain-containing protein [Oceanobacillus caeni]MCR1835141.1 YhgE/Pip domain-containing protein [Oceanobacillus caeni]